MTAAFLALDLGSMAGLGIRLVAGVTLIWLLASVAVIAMRRSSAALRHRAWALSTLAALTLPGMLLVLPEARLGLVGLRDAKAVGIIASPPVNTPNEVPPLSQS